MDQNQGHGGPNNQDVGQTQNVVALKAQAADVSDPYDGVSLEEVCKEVCKWFVEFINLNKFCGKFYIIGSRGWAKQETVNRSISITSWISSGYFLTECSAGPLFALTFRLK